MAAGFIAELCERVRDHAERKAALRIRGGGSKDFYGDGARDGEVIEMGACSGIVAYEPRELVLTVRAGTPVEEVERTLAGEGQMLAFEPPRFGSSATVGGTVACGLSGPRRPYAGAVRDFVLGMRIVNGKGEDLSFGGRVIKNVAGYDVSRLMAGALGTLGILTEMSFKVLPRPGAEATLAFELDEAEAIRRCNTWAGQPLPISGAAWEAGTLRVRLSGSAPVVDAAREKLGGETDAEGARYWEELREHRSPFFAGEAPLWRVSVPQTTPPLFEGHAQVVDWGGGVRWLRGSHDSFTIRSEAERRSGHATLFRGGERSAGVFHPLQPAIARIHRRLKAAFDPAGILNPGRLYDF